MAAENFDYFTRSLGDTSRRRFIKRVAVAVTGAALALVGRTETEAAFCRGTGSICREHASCCSGLCIPGSAGRRRCA